MGAQPFRIDVEQRVLDDLRARLGRARFSTLHGERDWDYGTSGPYLREPVSYWRHGYDRRAHEAKLNALPQRKSRIEDVDLHFVHLEGRCENARCRSVCGSG